MRRLVFSSADLTRVRLRGTLGPLAETVLALRALREPGMPADWRRRCAGRLPASALTAAGWLAARETLTLELCVLSGRVATFRQGLAALRGEVANLAPVLAPAFRIAVEPHWAALRASLDAEHAARSRTLADGGVGRLLGTLHASVRWRDPAGDSAALEIAGAGPDRDHHLGGRGLDVVPAVFCRDAPLVHVPAEGPLTLIYPAAWPGEPPARPAADGLAHLLGQTRAGVLSAAADGCTTSELARRLRISPAGASQHATVLRRAGLILSTRRGNAVLHTLTPLGAALLSR